MSYTGDVSVGGPAETRELPGLTITKVAVGPMNNNAYLLRCTSTGELLLIDAANEAGTLLELIGDTPPAKIVTTHRHRDHWEALREVQEATGAELFSQPLDQPICQFPLPGPEGGGVPLRPVHVVNRYERRLATHRQPDVALVERLVDRAPKLVDLPPLAL